MEKFISYYNHESQMVKLERANVRLWILVIFLIIALVGTNAGWLYFESQFEDTVVTQEVDTGEGNTNVTGIGDINGAD